MRSLSVFLPLILATATMAWAPPPSGSSANSRIRTFASSRIRTTVLPMALNYNDPVVASEFSNVQPMTFEEVEEELLQSGVRVSQSMNDMDVKLMLVELRMRLSGKMPGQTANSKKKPTSFTNKFEEAIWNKPAFAKLYNNLKSKRDHNAMNVASEYMNSKEIALQRYGKEYKRLIAELEDALNAAAEVTSPTITFSGFPANMGEMGCRMTLEALGPVVDFECVQSEDFPVLTGKVTFEDIETAKKAIKQYNGMNMGMGTALEIVPV